MSEKSPAPIHWKKPADRGLVEIERHFEVVTPVFGGGPTPVEHKKPIDPLTPIRGTALRGHLRTWWRITSGLDLPAALLLAEEEGVWGAASMASTVELRVDQSFRSTPHPIYEEYTTRNGKKGIRPLRDERVLAYAAFPLQPADKAEDKSPGTLTALEGEAVMTLTVPRKDAEAVERSVDAWLLLGGIGGRCRRGFGAVSPAGDPPTKRDLQARLRTLLGSSAAYRLSRPMRDPLEALDHALGALQRFRQGTNVGRNQGMDNRPAGRSRWPEADTIRRLTGQNDSRHSPEHTVQKFPRAEFGLPIIFHFKDKKDPDDTNLHPKGSDRWPSPLFLRPVKTAEGWHGLAILLPDRFRFPSSLELDPRLGEVRSDLSRDEADQVTPLDGNPDPLLRFLDFFEIGR